MADCERKHKGYDAQTMMEGSKTSTFYDGKSGPAAVAMSAGSKGAPAGNVPVQINTSQSSRNFNKNKKKRSTQKKRAARGSGNDAGSTVRSDSGDGDSDEGDAASARLLSRTEHKWKSIAARPKTEVRATVRDGSNLIHASEDTASTREQTSFEFPPSKTSTSKPIHAAQDTGIEGRDRGNRSDDRIDDVDNGTRTFDRDEGTGQRTIWAIEKTVKEGGGKHDVDISVNVEPVTNDINQTLGREGEMKAENMRARASGDQERGSPRLSGGDNREESSSAASKCATKPAKDHFDKGSDGLSESGNEWSEYTDSSRCASDQDEAMTAAATVDAGEPLLLESTQSDHDKSGAFQQSEGEATDVCNIDHQKAWQIAYARVRRLATGRDPTSVCPKDTPKNASSEHVEARSNHPNCRQHNGKDRSREGGGACLDDDDDDDDGDSRKLREHGLSNPEAPNKADEWLKSPRRRAKSDEMDLRQARLRGSSMDEDRKYSIEPTRATEDPDEASEGGTMTARNEARDNDDDNDETSLLGENDKTQREDLRRKSKGNATLHCEGSSRGGVAEEGRQRRRRKSEHKSDMSISKLNERHVNSETRRGDEPRRCGVEIKSLAETETRGDRAETPATLEDSKGPRASNGTNLSNDSTEFNASGERSASEDEHESFLPTARMSEKNDGSKNDSNGTGTGTGTDASRRVENTNPKPRDVDLGAMSPKLPSNHIERAPCEGQLSPSRAAPSPTSLLSATTAKEAHGKPPETTRDRKPHLLSRMSSIGRMVKSKAIAKDRAAARIHKEQQKRQRQELKRRNKQRQAEQKRKYDRKDTACDDDQSDIEYQEEGDEDEQVDDEESTLLTRSAKTATLKHATSAAAISDDLMTSENAPPVQFDDISNDSGARLPGMTRLGVPTTLQAGKGKASDTRLPSGGHLEEPKAPQGKQNSTLRATFAYKSNANEERITNSPRIVGRDSGQAEETDEVPLEVGVATGTGSFPDISSPPPPRRLGMEDANEGTERPLYPLSSKPSIWLAVRRGDVATVEATLAAGAAIDEGDEEGRTPLMVACATGDPVTANFLLNCASPPASVAARTVEDWTPLMIACGGGKLDVVKLLVTAGAALRDRDSTFGSNTLMWACGGGHAEVVRYLLNQGAWDLLRSTNGEMCSPLMIACDAGSLETVRILVEEGADLDAYNKQGDTALDIATLGNHRVLECYLKAEGARSSGEFWDAVDTGDAITVSQLLRHNGHLVNVIDKDGRTALLLACIGVYMDLTKTLVEAGADVDFQDPSGASPLSISVVLGHMHLTRYLVQDGGTKITSRNQAGWTPLMQAVAKGDLTMARYLVDKGAAVNDGTPQGDSVLDLARRFDNPEMEHYLASKGGFSSHEVERQIEEVNHGGRGLFRLW